MYCIMLFHVESSVTRQLSVVVVSRQGEAGLSFLTGSNPLQHVQPCHQPDHRLRDGSLNRELTKIMSISKHTSYLHYEHILSLNKVCGIFGHLN